MRIVIGFYGSRDITFPDLISNGIVFLLACTKIYPSEMGYKRIDFTLPECQSASTVTPHRVRSPEKLPSFHCFGKAGSKVMSVGVDCSIISAIPAEPPKFPSI